jgi:dephospho-CoA kinase
MKWIGLTGGIASGKSTVSRVLRKKGFSVVDADELARQVVEPGQSGLAQVVSAFGTDLLDPDGRLDRRKLGKLVFGRPEQLRKLEALLHPLIQSETMKLRQQAESRGEAFAFYDVPLLFEKNMQTDFDAIIVVSSSPELQIQRMKSRDGLTDQEVRERLGSQISLSEKEGKATWVIRNEGSLSELESQVSQLISQIQDQFPSGKAR